MHFSGGNKMSDGKKELPVTGDGIVAKPGNWTFSGDASVNFDQHVSKSVPLYMMGHDLICDLSDYFVQTDSIIYDIGCSTGTLTYRLGKHISATAGAKVIGIDREPDMIDVANQKTPKNLKNVELICEDIASFELEKANMIVCYYTIQFINPSIRQALIDKFYNSLNWGGALLLFEKVRGADARFQDILSGLYLDYKLRQGYSPNDIIGKSRSLKGVLEPFSSKGNVELLERAGFTDVNSVFKYICFEGFLGIK